MLGKTAPIWGNTQAAAPLYAPPTRVPTLGGQAPIAQPLAPVCLLRERLPRACLPFVADTFQSGDLMQMFQSLGIRDPALAPTPSLAAQPPTTVYSTPAPTLTIPAAPLSTPQFAAPPVEQQAVAPVVPAAAAPTAQAPSLAIGSPVMAMRGPMQDKATLQKVWNVRCYYFDGRLRLNWRTAAASATLQRRSCRRFASSWRQLR